MTTTTTKSAAETQKYGKRFARKLSGGGVVCLYGDLGAGKTTLVQGIARGLGIENRIISPTFILVRRYETKDKKYCFHIDLYRLTSTRDAKAIGIEELLADPSHILLIEWPEKIESILPAKHWTVRLQTISKDERRIIVKEARN